MNVDKVLCFKWQCYGDECDVVVRLSFYVRAWVTEEEFIVNDIYGIECSGFEFSDGRPPLPWTDHSRLCDQFRAAFKICYREDIGELQSEVQDKAREVLGPKIIPKPITPQLHLDYLKAWPN